MIVIMLKYIIIIIIYAKGNIKALASVSAPRLETKGPLSTPWFLFPSNGLLVL